MARFELSGRPDPSVPVLARGPGGAGPDARLDPDTDRTQPAADPCNKVDRNSSGSGVFIASSTAPIERILRSLAPLYDRGSHHCRVRRDCGRAGPPDDHMRQPRGRSAAGLMMGPTARLIEEKKPAEGQSGPATSDHLLVTAPSVPTGRSSLLTRRWRGPDSNHRSRESAWCRRSRSRRLFR
jgi:hypothetical protein